MATVSNLNIDQGATFSSTINLDNQASGVFELNDYSARGKIRKSYRSQTYTTFACVINENSPSQDTITISLTSAQTKALKDGRYVYDVEIYNATTSEVIRVLEGQIEVLASASQANPLGEGIEFKYTEENFVPHYMYDPITGNSNYVGSYVIHMQYMNLGYVHVYPIGADNTNYTAENAATSQSALEQVTGSTSEAASNTTNNSPSETQTSDGGGAGASGY